MESFEKASTAITIAEHTSCQRRCPFLRSRCQHTPIPAALGHRPPSLPEAARPFAGPTNPGYRLGPFDGAIVRYRVVGAAGNVECGDYLAEAGNTRWIADAQRHATATGMGASSPLASNPHRLQDIPQRFVYSLAQHCSAPNACIHAHSPAPLHSPAVFPTLSTSDIRQDTARTSSACHSPSLRKATFAPVILV